MCRRQAVVEIDGEGLRKLRQNAGLSAEALADRTADGDRWVGPSTITRVERLGVGFPRTVAALADALGVAVDDLRSGPSKVSVCGCDDHR